MVSPISTSTQAQVTLLEMILMWLPQNPYTEASYMELGGIGEGLETRHFD